MANEINGNELNLDTSRLIVEQHSGFILYRQKENNLLHEVRIINYKTALENVICLVEKIIQTNDYYNKNIKFSLLNHIDIIREILNSDLHNEYFGQVVKCVYELHRPAAGLGSEMNFLLSFFMVPRKKQEMAVS